GKVLQIYSEPIDNSCSDTANTEFLHVKNTQNDLHVNKEILLVKDNSNVLHVKKESSTEKLNYIELSEKEKEKANQRAKILKEYESASKRGVCVVDFLKICDVTYPEERLNEAKLFRWRREFKKKGIIALADKRGLAKAGTTKLKEWQQEFILNKFRVFGAGGINFYQLWDALHKEAGDRGEVDYHKFLLGEVKPICDYGVVKRFIENYYKDNHLEHLMVTKGEDKVKSYLQPAMGNQKELITYRNECWQIDSSPLDVIVLDEDGKQLRPSILSIVDVFSGRCVTSLNKTSNSLAIVRLLWQAIEKLGKPTYIKGDNGKDYLSKQFQELLNGLGIDYDRAIAYSGDEKGSVERHFRTLQHSEISFAHGYIGSCLAQREAIEQRTPKKERTGKDKNGNPIKTNLTNLMTFKEMEVLLQETTLKWEITRIRRKSKLSAVDKWNSCSRELKSIEYAEFLLYASPNITRVVGKKGIVIDNITYISVDMPCVGTEVNIRHNIDNMCEIYIFDKKGKFICTATDKEASSMTAEDFKQSKKIFKEETKEVRKLLKSAEISDFTKLNLAVDLEKMQEVHKEALKIETMQNSSNVESVKEKIKEQKEFRAITSRDFEAPDVAIMRKKKKVSWDDLVEENLKGA
ncbi:MAG: DDE-type integrase/transposase/recombinase, partial [Campylobacteraceae bacterium]